MKLYKSLTLSSAFLVAISGLSEEEKVNKDLSNMVKKEAVIETTEAPKKISENDGQDPTKPLTRFDIRHLFTKGINVNGKEYDQNTTILRIDKPIPLKNRWTFYWRSDVSIIKNDIPTGDNPNGDDEIGLGNWFNQFIMIAPPKKYPLGIQTFGIGAQVKLDMGQDDQFGNGTNSFVPLLAWKWQYKNIAVIPVFKYEFDFGDQRQGDVANFQFKPIVNIGLPNRWFLSFFDSTDITYQNEGKYDGEWNVPIDIMLGKRFVGGPMTLGITDQVVYSIQYIDYLKDNANAPDKQVQFRIGFFF